jgi:hypothetical protein
MLATLVTGLGSDAVLAASQSDGEMFLLAIGPAGAALFYFGLWRYYRNTDKSHSFERDTRITAQPVTGQDLKVNEISGTKASRIERGNHTDHRERVQRIS